MKKAIMLLLLASPTSAQLLPETPWNQAEFDSLVAVTRGCTSASLSYWRAFAGWKNDGQSAETNRDLVGTATLHFADAAHSCNDALMSFYGSASAAGGRGLLTRAEQVQRAKDATNRAISQMQRGQDALPGNSAYDDARNNAQIALSNFGGYDGSLAYAAFEPSYYPAIVGLHGDYGFSFRTFGHEGKYIAHLQGNQARALSSAVTPVFSEVGRDQLAKSALHLFRAMAAFFHAASSEALVFTPDDWARIGIYVAASQLHRDATFFKSLLAADYTVGSSSAPDQFAGAQVNVPYHAATSLSSFWLEFQRAFGNAGGLVDANTPQWAQNQIKRIGGIAFGITEAPFGESAADITDLWGPGLDNYMWGIFGFFHGVTTPPPGLTCDPATTTEVNGVCVGNPVSPCSPFAPAVTSINATTVQVECVEVP